MRINRHVFVLLFTSLAICALFFGTDILNKNNLIFGDDIHRSYVFLRQFWIDSWRSGELPLWNPYLFSGTPFAANPSISSWYPPLLLFFLLPIGPAFSVLILFHIFVAVIGMYLFLYKLFLFHRYDEKRCTLPALLGGVTFALSGYIVSRISAGHIEILQSVPYIPFVLYAMLRLRGNATWKNAALFALLFGMQILSGYATITLFTGILCLFFFVTHFLHPFRFQEVLYLLVAGFLGIGIASVTIFPQLEFVSRSIRNVSYPYEWGSYGSLEMRSFLQLFDPYINGINEQYTGTPPNYPEQSFFVGRITVGLAFFVLISFCIFFPKFRGKTVVLFGVLVCIYGIWVSLGSNIPIDLNKFLWEHIRLYHHLRFPQRHGIFIVVGITLLGSLGLVQVKNRLIQGTLLLLVTSELVLFGRNFIHVESLYTARHDKSLITTFQQDPYMRVLPNYGVWLPPRDIFDPDSAGIYKILSASGYDPSILASYHRFIDMAQGKEPLTSLISNNVQAPYVLPPSPLVDFLSIKYLIHSTYGDPLEGQGNSSVTLLRDEWGSGLQLYENKNALPLYRLTNTIQTYESRDLLEHDLQVGKIDLTKSVSVLNKNFEVDGGNCNGGSVKIREYKRNSVQISVSSPCNQVLASSEVWYPGWRVMVNNQSSDIIKIHDVFRGVLVPKGESTIIFTFQPDIFVYAMLGSFISIVIVLVLLPFQGEFQFS